MLGWLEIRVLRNGKLILQFIGKRGEMESLCLARLVGGATTSMGLLLMGGVSKLGELLLFSRSVDVIWVYVLFLLVSLVMRRPVMELNILPIPSSKVKTKN